MWHHFPNYPVMEQKNTRKFYLTYIFLGTGFSFLLFTLMLSIVDGDNIKLFLWIGLSNFILGLLTWTTTLANRRNKSSLTP